MKQYNSIFVLSCVQHWTLHNILAISLLFADFLGIFSVPLSFMVLVSESSSLCVTLPMNKNFWLFLCPFCWIQIWVLLMEFDWLEQIRSSCWRPSGLPEIDSLHHHVVILFYPNFRRLLPGSNSNSLHFIWISFGCFLFLFSRSTISREKFEELCGDLWEEALVPVKEVLKHSGLKVDDIYAVELIGGATRVPKLQVILFSPPFGL